MNIVIGWVDVPKQGLRNEKSCRNDNRVVFTQVVGLGNEKNYLPGGYFMDSNTDTVKSNFFHSLSFMPALRQREERNSAGVLKCSHTCGK